VSHALFDHTSLHRLIESQWSLKPLTQRDASSLATDPGNLAALLTPTSPDKVVPDLPQPAPPAAVPCGPLDPGPAGLATDSTWEELKASPLVDGWGL
jgi:hypothetical protein